LELMERRKVLGYFEVISNLKTRSKCLNNTYSMLKKFFMVVFTNCKECNPPESEYNKCASILDKFFTEVYFYSILDKFK
uniref:Uncharacterized protein n=1 Tax=Equus asinus asinus TaxID=83772 RepID=A0A8C4LH59_EQUAS